MSSLDPLDPRVTRAEQSLPPLPPPSASSGELRLTRDEIRALSQLGFDVLGETAQQYSRTHFVFLHHMPTGARAVLIQNEDDHFRAEIRLTTLPSDNTGVFHKLEHAVAAGSHGADVYDEMTRSLFLTECNAYTGLDETLFVASGIDSDTVYTAFRLQMDLVLAGPPSFDAYQREHGHLVPDSRSSCGFAFSGVVHEEMKGYYSSPVAWIQEIGLKALFSSDPFCYVAGGKPRDMMGLTYEQFVGAYQKFYTPSNLSIALYGGESVLEKARVLAQSLEGRVSGSLRSELPPREPAASSKEVWVDFPADLSGHTPVENQYKYYCAWRLPKLSDPQEKFEMEVLYALLDNGEWSPFAQHLRENEVPMTYLGVSKMEIGHDLVFQLSFQDGTREELSIVQNAVAQGVERFIGEGFPSEVIEALLVSCESDEEAFLRSSRRGESIVSEAVTALRRGENEVDPLSVVDRVRTLREKLGEGIPVFERMLERLVGEASSLTDIFLVPQENLIARESEVEAKQVASLVASLSKDEKEELSARAARLLALERKSAKDLVPVASLKSRYRHARREPVEQHSFGRFGVSFHEQDLGSQCKVSIDFEVSALESRQIHAARIASMMLSDIGMKGMSPGDFVTETLGEGASIAATLFQGEVASDYLLHHPRVRGFFSLKATMQTENHERPLQLIEGLIRSPELAHIPTLERVLSESVAGYRSSLNDPEVLVRLALARAYAVRVPWGSALLRETDEQLLSAYSDALRQFESDPAAVVRELEAVHQTICQRSPGTISVIGNRTAWEALRPRLEALGGAFPIGEPLSVPEVVSDMNSPRVVGVVADLNNSFLGMTVPLGGRVEDAALRGGRAKIFSQLLDRHLFVQVREAGKAYGAGARFQVSNGVFALYSAQDPNVVRSREVIRSASQAVIEMCTEDALARAKVSVMKEFEQPMSPDKRGSLSAFREVYGISYAIEDECRAGILDCTVEHIREIASQFQRGVEEASSLCIYGSEGTLREVQQAGGPLVITPRFPGL